MEPLVSVIVPFYNMEPFLAETLDSILKSDYPAIEIVTIDDGSKDNSLAIAREYEKKYPIVSVYTQSNKGVCAARNAAISKAKGKYILPVDSDNLISPELIRLAVDEFKKDPDVKVVYPRAEFFGDRSGEWKLPEFSLRLLARKNMIDTCAMYPRQEWERVNGYPEEVRTREDWAFWISVLKDGGKVVRIPHTGLYYRIRPTSKRVTNRKFKSQVVDQLNKRHPEFFQRELNGPLRYHRSWSRIINSMPVLFQKWLGSIVKL